MYVSRAFSMRAQVASRNCERAVRSGDYTRQRWWVLPGKHHEEQLLHSAQSQHLHLVPLELFITKLPSSAVQAHCAW